MSDGQPCPACGEPLYGWIVAPASDPRRTESYVVDRCESCGLGVTRGGAEAVGDGGPGTGRLDCADDPDVSASRLAAGLGPGERAELRVPNRRSLQASLGGDHWAALDLPAQRLHLTPRSVSLLLQRHGLDVTVRQPPLGANLAWMWQTLVNGFTLQDNLVRELARGRFAPRGLRGATAFAVDAVVSLLVAVPLAVAALVLELVAALVGRGGLMVLSVRRR